MDGEVTLRTLIERDEIVVTPGVNDPLTARIAELAGFEAVTITGYGTSISKTGYPDVGLITMSEMVENARNVVETVDIPVKGDSDTGYGNATNVVRTVREFIKTGIGGVHMEDQTFPKRCGSIAGKRVIDADEMVGKVQAAADVRDERNEEFFIMARTDARGAVDGSLDEAIERANRYVSEGGADGALVAGMTSIDELERVGEEVDANLYYETPLVGPRVEPERLESFGFDIVALPLVSLQSTIVHLFKTLEKVRSEGISAYEALESEFEELPTKGDTDKPRQLIHEITGLEEVQGWEREYLPEEDQEKYADSIGAE